MKRICLILFTAMVLAGCATTTAATNRQCEVVGNREPPLLICDQGIT